MFQIPLPNSEYVIVLVVCFVYLCENTVFLSCVDKEEKCLLEAGPKLGFYFWGGGVCSYNARQIGHGLCIARRITLGY